jgi:hypothetical protein
MSDEDIQRLRRALETINSLDQPLEGKGAIIVRAMPQTMYLCGYPYLWTAYGERAFVFANTRQAQGIIARFSLPATVHTRNP